MTFQFLDLVVIRERDRTGLALESVAAGAADNERRITLPANQYQRLLSTCQRFVYRIVDFDG